MADRAREIVGGSRVPDAVLLFLASGVLALRRHGGVVRRELRRLLLLPPRLFLIPLNSEPFPLLVPLRGSTLATPPHLFLRGTQRPLDNHPVGTSLRRPTYLYEIA